MNEFPETYQRAADMIEVVVPYETDLRAQLERVTQERDDLREQMDADESEARMYLESVEAERDAAIADARALAQSIFWLKFSTARNAAKMDIAVQEHGAKYLGGAK